jgi:hypothetical protein
MRTLGLASRSDDATLTDLPKQPRRGPGRKRVRGEPMRSPERLAERTAWERTLRSTRKKRLSCSAFSGNTRLEAASGRSRSR